MGKPRAVILDVDGTLIDSNDAHARAWVDVGEEMGYEIAFDRVRPMIGMGGDKVLPRLTGLTKSDPEGKRVLDRRGEIFRTKYLPDLEPQPGTRALLERMRDEGMTLVVATSARRDELGGLLDRAGIADLIEASTSSTDAENSKPDADIVQAALEDAGADPDAVIMIGDTPYDVDAAARAGVRVIAVRCGGWGDEPLAGAVAVYDDPADLLRRYASSPFGEE